MKKNAIKLLFLIVLTVATSLQLPAQKWLNKIVTSGEIRIGMSGNQPPFSMYDKNDNLMGYEVDLANLLAEEMGLKLILVPMPFAQLMPALGEGRIDAIMSGMTITPKRNLKALFVGPYIVSGKSIITKSSTLAMVDDLEDLNLPTTRLVALQGSTSEELIRKFLPKATLVVTENYDLAVKMVLNNKADAMFGDYPVCVYTKLKYPLENLYVLDQPLTIEPIGMALPPDGYLLHNLVQNYINSLMIFGLLDLLEAKWFDSGQWLDQVKN